MRYHNPNDPVVATPSCTVNETAFRVGVLGARTYTLRNEAAQNPFKPETVLWYSFNFGARTFLEALPTTLNGNPVDPGTYRTFTFSTH